MARKRFFPAAGRVLVLEHHSRLLQGNPLGDPHIRKLPVWLPPDYDQAAKAGRGQRFPVLYSLAGFIGAGPAHTNWKPFGDNVPERAARLLREGKMGPTIIVFPDAFTALGGNQYINSTAIGPYADYLTRELIPFVDKELRTLADRNHRGCFGKSSGGYGAMIHGMKYPQHWGAIANHSGDAYFEFLYQRDWPNTLSELSKHRGQRRRAGDVNVDKESRATGTGQDDGRVARFLKHVWGKEKLSYAEGHCLMNLAMAASYDPDPKAPLGFALPFDLETGAPVAGRWAKWRRHDPIHLVARYRDNLRSLRGLFIDCGWRDQYHIHYGARILSQQLRKQRVAHSYQEFEDDHSDIDYRMDISLPFLYSALRP